MFRFLLSLILVSLITPPTVVMATSFQLKTSYALVQPIFKEKCGMCHNSATMPSKDWTKYEDAFKYKEIIRKRIVKKEMPPQDMPSLTTQEFFIINDWVVDGGMK